MLNTPLREVTAELGVRFTSPTSMTWTQLRGDAKSFDGRWTLTQVAADRTLVEYVVAIDLGRMGMLVRGPAKAAGRAVLSSMPSRLKSFVESDVV